MKTLIATVALATLTATAGLASTLSGLDRDAIRTVAPGVNLDGLSADQARALADFAASGDMASNAGAANFVRSVVNS